MALIQETFYITADNTDILAAPSRLASIPFNGVLQLEISAIVADGTNNMELSIQLPDGSTPVDGQFVPANGYSTGHAVVHKDTAMRYRFRAPQGGHFGISCVETGTAFLFVVATLSNK